VKPVIAVPVSIAGTTEHITAVVRVVWFSWLCHHLPSDRWQAPV